MNQFCHWCPFRKTWQHILLYLRQPRNPKGQNFLPMAWPSGIQVIKENNEWSCMTFDKHVRQTKCSLYGVMVTGPSARGRRGGGLGQGLIDCLSPVNCKYTSHYSVFLRSSNDFCNPVSCLLPSLSKHTASWSWKTAYPCPKRMISSHILPLISFISLVPPNLCWTLPKTESYFNWIIIYSFSLLPTPDHVVN